MTIIRSISLRVFPGRKTTSYAVTWRTESRETQTDRRLWWGVLPYTRAGYDHEGISELLRAVLEDIEGGNGHRTPAPRAGSPLGAVGGGSQRGQGLPGIDPDE